jgi:mRNA interferase RelE/StbE
MKSWSLFLTHVAEKDLAKLPERDLQAVIQALDRLTQNPSSVDIRKLKGCSNDWRLRVGKWRVRFMFVAKTQMIQILRVLPRKSAY